MPSLFDFINDLFKSRRSSEDEDPASVPPISLINWPDLGVPAAPAATRPAGDVLTGASGSATLAGGSGDDGLKAATADGGEEKWLPSPDDGKVKELATGRRAALDSGDRGRTEGSDNALSGYHPDDRKRIREAAERMVERGPNGEVILTVPPLPEDAGPIDPKTLTGEQVFDALQVPKDPAVFAEGGWKKKMEATLEALAELDRTNPGRAKEIRTKVSALHEARAKADIRPTGADEVRDRITPTATAKILPDGNRTVVVNATTPKKGAILPPDSVRVPDKEMTPDGMLATLRGMARHVGKYTDLERKAGTSLAYRLERLKERDPKAFGKLPGELRNFLGFFKEQMDDERSAIVPKNLKDTTVELPPDAWEKITDKSADHALMRSVRAFGPRMAMRGAVNKPADIADFAGELFNSDKAKKFAEDYRGVTHRAIPVPSEYEDDPVLQVAEEVGGWGAKSLAKRGLKSLLKIFKK